MNTAAGHRRLHDPVPLVPLRPLARGLRRERCVRTREGETQTRMVLELAREPPSAAPTESSSVFYTFKKLCYHEPKKGVSIVLATPTISKDHPSPCLVSCGSPVVIKILRHPTKATTVDSPLREIAALQLLNQNQSHPNIIGIIDVCEDDDYVFIILPYMPGGDLFLHLQSQKDGLPEAAAASYLRQVAQGLLYMKRSQCLAHHDISLENVVFSSDGTVQLIDLGMCIKVPHLVDLNGKPLLLKPQVRSGKPGYIPPEVLKEVAFDPFAADIWSLAVMLYIMITGRPLYGSPKDTAFKILAGGGVRQVVEIYQGYGLQLSPHASDLICRMLHADPLQRLTIEEVLFHPFITLQHMAPCSKNSNSSTPAGQGSTTTSRLGVTNTRDTLAVQ